MKCKNCSNDLSLEATSCNKCGALIEHKICRTEYFSISLTRLFLLSVITLGIYQFYFFYKNWIIVKKSENSTIFPVVRALLPVIFCYSLFKRVFKSAEMQGYRTRFMPCPAAFIAIVYSIFLIISSILTQFSFSNLFLKHFIVSILMAFPILAVQNAINFNNAKIKGSPDLRKIFSRGEILLIIFGILVFFIVAQESWLLRDEYKVVNKNTKTENISDFKTNFINLTVQKLKNGNNLPMKIDDKTTIVDITAEPNAIRYYIAVSGIDSSLKETNESLRNSLIPYACKKFAALLITGVNLEFAYDVKDNGDKYFVSFTKNDCYLK